MSLATFVESETFHNGARGDGGRKRQDKKGGENIHHSLLPFLTPCLRNSLKRNLHCAKSQIISDET